MSWWSRITRWRSFLRPRVLERVTSSHHPLLVVVESRGERRLDGALVNHSRGGLADVLGTAFDRLEIGRTSSARVDTFLMLGFGAGSAVELLRARGFDPRVTAVEIDARVVELAQRWFGWRDDPRVEFVVADAADWLRGELPAYDLVLVDVFVEDRIPASLRTRETAERLVRCVAPGGWLLVNCMDGTDARASDTQDVERALRSLVDGVRSERVRGNRIVSWKRPRER